MKRFAFKVIGFISLLSIVGSLSSFADDQDLTPLAGDILKESFRAREQLRAYLDGSETASGISRSTQVVNELVYLSAQKWRARRQLPFSEQSFEFMMTDKGVRLMNPFNHGVEPPYSVGAKTYLEVLISPLRFAEAWNLDGASSLDSLLKAARKGPLQNQDGDKIELEEKDGTITLKLSGKILQDGKTKVNIEAIWQILDKGKISETQLNTSLMRSL